MVPTARTEAGFTGMAAEHPSQVRFEVERNHPRGNNHSCPFALLVTHANGDVQPIEGAFGAACYITQYASKTEQPNEDQTAPRTAAASRSSVSPTTSYDASEPVASGWQAEIQARGAPHFHRYRSVRP